MKILKIVLTNLNSLRGTHVVDFEAEPLASGGLFAITGPTGAGKTTLLDAMTLALYGHAARYGTDAKPEDMMSRHTGECSAEVTFQVARGKYRAEWRLKRARGKADGNMQGAKRYLYDADGAVLAQSLTEVKEKIELLVGLNYERFLRSVLLAQGDFALFLKAKPKERAEILESLTGTVIYSELGTLAFEEERRRTHELNIQKEALGQTVLLTEEERAEKTQEIETQSAIQKTQQAELKTLNDKLAQSNDLVKALKGEQESLEAQAALLEKRKTHEPDLQKLELHRATLPFTADLSAVISAESTFAEQQEELKQAEADQTAAQNEWLRGLVTAKEFSRRLLAEAESNVEHWKQEQNNFETKKKELEAWLQKEKQDATLVSGFPGISTQLGHLENHRAAHISLQNNLKNVNAEIISQLKKIEEFKENLEKAKQQLGAAGDQKALADTSLNNILNGKTKNVYDEELEDLRILERGLDQLASKAELVAKQQKTIAAQRHELDGIQPQIEEAAQKEKLAIAAKTEAEKNRDLRQDHLDKTRLIASLEDHRADLKEGEECPLCGATEHPLITGEITLTAMSVLEEELARAKVTLKEKEDEWHGIEKTLAALQSSQEQLTKTLADTERNFASAQAEVQKIADSYKLKDADAKSINEAKEAQAAKTEELKQHLLKINVAMDEVSIQEKALSEAAHQVEIDSAKLASGNEALDRLQETQKTISHDIENAQRRIDEVSTGLSALLKPYQVSLPEHGFEKNCQNELSTRSTEYQKQKAQYDKTSSDLEKAGAQLEKCGGELTNLQSKSTPIIQEAGEHAKEIQETGIKENQQLLATWQKMEDAERSLQQLQTIVARTETTRKNRLDAKAGSERKFETLTAALTERVERSDFATINELRMSQLAEDVVQQLEELKKNLQSEEDQLKGALDQCRKEIQELRATKAAEGEEALVLKARQAELQKVAADLSEQIGAIKMALKQDEEARKTHAAKLVEIEEMEKRLHVWRQLQELIGSRDGKKFSLYAQGISLEVLVHHANEHMRRLTKRYSMRRCNTEDLDLEIVDHDQAEAGRPMASLSGGESFITSLALALGLASMAGKKTQIDSLFVDEGFGSLDADSLDLAISALESLRANSKTIGVISHVDLLKERIAVQIAVRKQSGGVSTLSVIPPVANAMAN